MTSLIPQVINKITNITA
jgi:hypothetical protein